MKKLATFVLIAVFAAAGALPAYPGTRSRTQDQKNNQALDRESRKAEKKQRKAQKKYAKAQKKAERKMLQTEKKNTTYKPRQF